MRIKTILRLIGLLLLIFSLSMLSPLLINYLFKQNTEFAFIAAFACTCLTGFALWYSCRRHKAELRTRDGFLIVVLFWFVLCGFAALPFLTTMRHHSHFLTDAVFEAVSGLTTTGISVLNYGEHLPRAVLYYRQQLQFLGGMGIIVLAVAILPMLGVGGMQLYQAETPGPMKDAKLTPRITQTAKALWVIYFTLTLACMLSYWLAGMHWFDALGESFATVSTGGFAMHHRSFSYYKSDLINTIACLFMLLGGTNFALHFVAFRKLSVKQYWLDEEFRNYLKFLLAPTILVFIVLVYGTKTDSYIHNFIKSLFTVTSFVTTTGYVSSKWHAWPDGLAFLLVLLSIIGGCAASTSGGIKIVRAILLYKQGKREMLRLLHPQAVIPLKLGRRSINENLLHSIWSFIAIFIVLFLVLMLIFMTTGYDIVTAFSLIAAALTNSGADSGLTQINFAELHLASKWILIFAMLAGRLEIFSLLILFTRQFWQK